MRYAWLVAVLVACGSSDQHHDAGYNPTHCSNPQPAPGPGCGTSCGNGVRDTCYINVPMDSPCPNWEGMTEACDGSDAPTCASLGYGRGVAGCTSSCTVDARTCDACGSDARIVDCAPAALGYLGVLTASAPGASGGPYLAVASGDMIQVLHHDALGFSIAGATQIGAGSIQAIAPLVDGWLVLSASTSALTVTRVDLLATTTTSHAVATIANDLSNASMAYGPGGRALVVWTQSTVDASNNVRPQTSTALVDANGATVVAAAVLVPASANLPGSSVTTDGTSFFVAVSTKVYRITSAGAVAATIAGYPLVGYPLPFADAPVAISWGSSNGWYASEEGANQWQLQAFDATGAAIGIVTANAPGPWMPPVAEGSDVIAAEAGPGGVGTTVPLVLTRTQPGGAKTSVTAGVLDTMNGYRALVTPFAGDLAVTWQGASKYYLALVAF